MSLDYLSDESEKSLAPFFLPRILFGASGIVMIAGVLALLLWPRKPALHLIALNSIPLHFFQITAVSLVLLAYINLHCGRGELIKKNYLIEMGKDTSPSEKTRSFITYGLPEFLIHSLFLIFPFLPILILSASLSGISLIDLLLALWIIFSTSLLCRLIGFATYLIWGRWNVVGYLTGIILSLFLIFISMLFWPGINPIILLYKLNNSVEGLRPVFMDSYSSFETLVITGNLFFILINFFLVTWHIKRTKKVTSQ